MRYLWYTLFFTAVLTVSILGFRGTKFLRPPLEIFPDMDRQAKLKPQKAFDFWDNQMTDRPIVEGTVPRGQGFESRKVFSADYSHDPSDRVAFYTGKDENGEWHRGIPAPVTHELMRQGQKRYNEVCALCHGEDGSGNGVTSKYGLIGAVSYHDERLINMAEGEIFNTITHGKGLMLPVANQVPVEDRWAVILYIRALQRMNQSTILDVGQPHRDALLDSQ